MAATSPGRLSSWARVIRPPWHMPATGPRPYPRPPGPLSAARARGARALKEIGAVPGFAEEVGGEEGEHRFVPDHGVAGVQDPVVLVREVQELHARGPARVVSSAHRRSASPTGTR